MGVFRVYVEKKKNFTIKANHLMEDIKSALGLSLDELRIINRYDIEGTSEALFNTSIPYIFADPPVDEYYFDLPAAGDHLLAVEYLPGQYDQRGDSAAQCFQLYHQGERPKVKTAVIYLFYGKLQEEDYQKLKDYLINPLESQEASLELPSTLDEDYQTDYQLQSITGFVSYHKKELVSCQQEYSLSMDLADLQICQEYFKRIQRDPNLAELKILDTYWSDHCRHTTFNTNFTKVSINDPLVEKSYRRYLKLRDFLYQDQPRPKTLMDLATIGARELKKRGLLNNLDESQEINACSVKVEVDVDGHPEDYLFMFKNETHNHPTEIEPFGGAATCLGGAIRDPLSGRSYVYQGMRVSGSGDLRSKTLPGKLPQRKISTGAALGFSSYGNQIGLATGLVEEIYHPGYVAKHMEVGAVLGAAPAKNVIRKEPLAGDIVILLGGKTGRDGCGGATGSSRSHNDASLKSCGAEVQKGNPVEERKLQRLFRNSYFTRLIKRCNDFGAGGVSVAVGELADSLAINLDAIPKKYLGLNGLELAISESQERMAIVIDQNNLSLVLKYADEENIEAAQIAEVTSDGYLSMFFEGQEIVTLEREFLNSAGALRTTEVSIPEYRSEARKTAVSWEALLADYNICSKQGLGEQFDSTIGGATVLMPYGGRRQKTPIQAMVARFPVLKGTTDTCSVFAYGFDPYLSEANPYLGAYTSVIHSIAKVVATGGSLDNSWLSFQEYFPKPGSDPEKWGSVTASLLGALEAQLALEIGAIGGKDSMSGNFNELEVPPTLISFAASTCNYQDVRSPEFKKAGNKIIYLTPEKNPDGLFQPDNLKELFYYIEELRKSNIAEAIYAVGQGGIAEAVAKMSFGNALGVDFTKDYSQEELFQSAYGSFILEVNEGYEKMTNKLGEVIGLTKRNYAIKLGDKTISLEALEKSWESPLENIYPIHHDPAEKVFSLQYHNAKLLTRSSIRLARPKAIVPVFPGTNCEYDTVKALEAAGADAEAFVLNNLSPDNLISSMKELEKKILNSQLLVLPGGFSGGDEPDGSAKLIASFFRSPRMEAAIMKLLYENDGLICGICNGFQALLKLGLVPFGKILEETTVSPTLTFNLSGKHQSSLVKTKVFSNSSPWLMDFNAGDEFLVAVSHGEGRFVADDQTINSLNAKGQIATVYVDEQGDPATNFPFNPNGSFGAIEGLLSPDGRIFGRMAHSERFISEVYRNVPGPKKMDIFTSGINYFR